MPAGEPWRRFPARHRGTGTRGSPIPGDAACRAQTRARCPRCIPGKGCPTETRLGARALLPVLSGWFRGRGSLTCACPRACRGRAAGWSRPCRGCTCRRRAGGWRGGRRHPWRRRGPAASPGRGRRAALRGGAAPAPAAWCRPGGAGWSGMGWDGMGWNGTARHGMGWNGAGRGGRGAPPGQRCGGERSGAPPAAPCPAPALPVPLLVPVPVPVPARRHTPLRRPPVPFCRAAARAGRAPPPALPRPRPRPRGRGHKAEPPDPHSPPVRPRPAVLQPRLSPGGALPTPRGLQGARSLSRPPFLPFSPFPLPAHWALSPRGSRCSGVWSPLASGSPQYQLCPASSRSTSEGKAAATLTLPPRTSVLLEIGSCQSYVWRQPRASSIPQRCQHLQEGGEGS